MCAVYQNYPGCPNVGWSFNLDTTKLSNGPHEFNITTVTTDGRVTASGDIQFQVSNTAAVGPTLVDVDAPSNGNTYSGSAVSASGWAIDATATISQVVLQVDGNTVGTATYGGSRPDVCNVYPGYPGCPNVGWNFTLNTTNLANGAHQLIAVATTSDGRSTSSGPAQFVVSNVALPTPLANIDLPSNGSTYSGTINPSGWAIDANYPITQVTLAVDGTQIGSATLGGYRPDVCAVYVGYAGCPNVGWTLALDTTTLSPGTHQMIATATTSDGRTTTSGQVQFQTAIAFDPTHPSKEYIRLGGQMIAIENAPQ